MAEKIKSKVLKVEKYEKEKNKEEWKNLGKTIKNIYKKISNYCLRLFYDVLLMWFVASIFLSGFLFYTGFHDVDQSRNVLKLDHILSESNINYSLFRNTYDVGSDGVGRDWDFWYVHGLTKMFVGFHILMFDIIIIVILNLKFRLKSSKEMVEVFQDG